VASSLAGVLAQRLVRRLCPECKAPYVPSDTELLDIGMQRATLTGHTVFKAVGCDACQSVGYRGRVGIYEFLPAWEEIKQLVIARADSGAIKRKTVELGMRTLREDGFLKVLRGFTSFDEVMRVTQMDNAEGD
jgi:type II secretory ATPase GspE/PulE/Tfp pilus assembly ATPase PilB-like protein